MGLEHVGALHRGDAVAQHVAVVAIHQAHGKFAAVVVARDHLVEALLDEEAWPFGVAFLVDAIRVARDEVLHTQGELGADAD
eukprot:27854-Eustigmatos_ZCMA.PRE.1